MNDNDCENILHKIVFTDKEIGKKKLVFLKGKIDEQKGNI